MNKGKIICLVITILLAIMSILILVFTNNIEACLITTFVSGEFFEITLYGTGEKCE